MPLSNEERAAERTAEAKDEDGTPPSPAELKAIWNDRERLRDWTWGMLLSDELSDRGVVVPWEAQVRAHEEAQRQWLHRLLRTDPVRYARLITRHRHLAEVVRARPVGRQPGRSIRLGYRDAWETKEFIQRKWREVFGHWYRKDLALEIAAALFSTPRNQITVQQLKDFNNNRKRRSSNN